jgi:integrase
VARAERVRRYVEAAKSENTKRAYASHFKDFQGFCLDRGYGSLPATPAAVIDYFTFLADIGAKMSTLQVKAAAISYAHRAAKLDSPMKSIEVQETLRGIRRTIGTAQKGKTPITLSELKKLLEGVPDSLRGTRDKAIILLGFAGAFRRSELVGLAVSDVTFERSRAVVHVRRSKTDQEGRGMTKTIPVLRDKSVCPVTALRGWLSSAGITKGAIFRPIDRWGNVSDRMMLDQEVARIIKKYADLASLDPTLFAGHSLRAGYVTEAADRDVPLWKIKQQTGHKNDAILQRYIRDKGRGSEDATKSVFGE